MSTAMHYFRENLKKIMDENGMSQKDLAKRVDVVPQALNKYLLGHRVPGLEIVDKFAQALNLSPHMLISDPHRTPQVYLSKEDVYEAFLKAHHKKNLESIFEKLSLSQQKELDALVRDFGGWDILLKFLEEESELKKKGSKVYKKVRESLLSGPQEPYEAEIPIKNAVTPMDINVKASR